MTDIIGHAPGLRPGFTRLAERLSRTRQRFDAWSRHREARRIFRELLHVDAAYLADIGLTPADIWWASRLPIECDAAAELEKIARPNHGEGWR